MLLLHPGDISLDIWLKLLGLAFLFCAVPVFIIGLIIYKVVKNHREK